MDTVIDAQVVYAYFQETVHETKPPLTGSASAVFERLGTQNQVFLDESRHIEQDWRDLVPVEWFDAWLAKLLVDDAAAVIPTSTCEALTKRLRKLGFPYKGRDIWYVRTASAVVEYHGQAVILTEDLDFYDPTQKQCAAKHRLVILHSSDGPIARCLCKKGNIAVVCVATYCQLSHD